MEIVKKIVGVVLLLLVAVFSLGTIFSFINAINETIKTSKASPAEGIGYALGSLIGLAIIVTIIYFIARFGLKLLKKKSPTKPESIEDIGK